MSGTTANEVTPSTNSSIVTPPPVAPPLPPPTAPSLDSSGSSFFTLNVSVEPGVDSDVSGWGFGVEGAVVYGVAVVTADDADNAEILFEGVENVDGVLVGTARRGVLVGLGDERTARRGERRTSESGLDDGLLLLLPPGVDFTGVDRADDDVDASTEPFSVLFIHLFSLTNFC